MHFRPSPSIRACLHALRPGQHLCLFYDRMEEQIGITIEFIRGGLEHGERCLYVSDSDTVAKLRETLHQSSLDAREALERRAIVLLPKEQAYLAGGRFDVEGMLTMLEAAVDSALTDGFTGLRAAGDMTWLLDEAPGSERAVEYEAMMNEFYKNSRALGLCLYDRQRLHPTALESALRTHPRVLIGDQCCGENPYYESPDVFFKRVDPRERFNWRLRQLRDRTMAQPE